MGLGVQSGWADPTDPSYKLSGSDLLKYNNDIKRLAVRPSGRWLRFDTSLISDGNWYPARVQTEQYDVDAESGQLLGTISGAADTFSINTTGLYDLAIRERFSGLANGDHGLRATIVGGSVLAENDIVIVPLHVQTNYCRTIHYLTAGQQIQFQHKYNGFGDSRDLTLYTTTPTPEVTIHMLGEHDLHA